MIRIVLLSAVSLALAAYVGIAALLFAFQRSIVFVPDTTRPDAPAVGLPSLHEVRLQTPDGLRLLAWWVPPAPGRPVLAYLHGNGGNLGDRRDRLRRFARAGLGVLMPEYPGYGGNPGSPSEPAFADAAEAAMAFLDHEGVEHRRIVVYGESIGTGVATRVAATHEVGALILESPFTSLADIARRRCPYLPIDLLLRDRFDQLSRIVRVHCPILVLQGAMDVIVPPDLGRKLFNAARQPKTLWIAPEGGHNDLFAHGGAEVVLGFVDRTKMGVASPG